MSKKGSFKKELGRQALEGAKEGVHLGTKAGALAATGIALGIVGSIATSLLSKGIVRAFPGLTAKLFF